MKTLFSLLVLTLFSWNALAAVGVVSALKGEAEVFRNGQALALTLNAPIEKSDRLQTKANAKVQLTFNDRTIITVGQNSQFEVNEFLQDTPDNSAFQGTLTQGFMRTMSGKIGKLAPSRFKIKTKTATIGIRGTIFTVQTDETTTTVATLSGATYLQVDQTGQTYNIPQNRQVTYNSQTGEVTETTVQNPGGTGDSQDENNDNSEDNADDNTEENSDSENTASEDNSETTEASEGQNENTAIESTNADENHADQVTVATEQAAQEANQGTLDNELTESNNTTQQDPGQQDPGMQLPYTASLSTLSEFEQANFAASGTPLLQFTVQDQLAQTDSPYAFGYWLDSINDSIEGFWAKGTLTQDTLDTIANAHTQDISATYMANFSQMSLSSELDITDASLGVDIHFGTGQVTTHFSYDQSNNISTMLTGTSTDLNALLNQGRFRVDSLQNTTPLSTESISGYIDGQLVGTANNEGVPSGLTGTIDLIIDDPQTGTHTLQGAYGTTDVAPISTP